MKDLPTVKQPSSRGQGLSKESAQFPRSWNNTPLLSTAHQLENFTKGLLVQIKDGATYEGIVYDRRLKVRLANSREWWIFDDVLRNEPLTPNEIYDFVISPYVAASWLAEALDPSVESETAAQPGHWQGTVVDPEWRVPPHAFRMACEELYEHEWILVATSFGNLILGPGDIDAEVKAGTIIQWTGTRPDLFAVV